MTLTVEFAGHTFTLALNRDEPEQVHPRGDIYATTERAGSCDFDTTPIGFVTSKGRS